MMSNLPWRLAGVALLAVTVVLYEPDAPQIWQRLGLPLLMAAAAWLMVQNVVAVALGTTLLAAIHSDPGNADPVQGIGYPLTALAAGIVLLGVLTQRFRSRVRATHADRWRHRRDAEGGAHATAREEQR
jgi:hypothetical protein